MQNLHYEHCHQLINAMMILLFETCQKFYFGQKDYVLKVKGEKVN